MLNLFLNTFLLLQMSTNPIIYGHRGARGLFPENTTEGFIRTVKMGINHLELDVVITADSQVVISHEPWFNRRVCTTSEGKKIRHKQQGNIFKMNYEEVRKFDCGQLFYPDFPKQEKFEAHKPLLKDMIAEVEKYCKEHQLPPVTYLIEIKSRKIGDNRFHPGPKRFAKLVYETIRELGISERIMVQSFDQRPLKEIRKLDSTLKLALLVVHGSVKKKIRQLGFTPYGYGPSHKFIKKKVVDEAHALGLKVLVWTVNDQEEAKVLAGYKVDGIITDYPDSVLNTLFDKRP
jgi:glycerophosphoryl diester phosphodiesterase